ncbi:atrial natriuretic peptide receptor 1 isoform X3 [Teleopsis dalmanni]|uniref:atrial natriuretic peptide receptor 1 isoform X3 n=1 Tax=Teleopsis dalmanni TaxID=139649 RepID=UPI0018CFBAE2|nr:atrial natriuretic peptide receptor 1 isoform X3 [Teleopsis dalmanni]
MVFGCIMHKISTLTRILLLLTLLLFQLNIQNNVANANQALTSKTVASEQSASTEIILNFQTFEEEATDNNNSTKNIIQNHHSNRHAVIRKEIIFVALLPSQELENKNDCIRPKVLPVLELAIAHIQRLGFGPSVHVDFKLISRDTFCSSIFGPIGFFEIYTKWSEIHAVFGLPCDYVLAPISRYAGVWQIPILTTGGNAGHFDKKDDSYPTLTRLRGAEMNNLGNVVRAIIDSFNWTRTGLIFQNDDIKVKGNSVCFFCMTVVHDKLSKPSIFQQGFDTIINKKSKVEEMLRKVSKQTRIVIMCADPQSIRQIMLTAEELKMIDSGEYVFINIELFSRSPNITSQPWFDKNDTAENNERARKAYTAMLTVTPKQPSGSEYTRVSEEIKSIAAAKYNYTFHDNEPISTFVTSFYDGVLLYANALNDSIREDPSVLTRPINGTDMVRRMWNRSFKGITGNVTIDANGDRVSAYSLLDMNPTTGRFEIVAHFLHNRLEYVPGKQIHWAGDRLEAPPDRPTCGYDGALCPDNSLPGYAILSIVLGVVVVIMIICFFFGYRHYKYEAELNSMSWKVSMDDIVYHDAAGRYFRGSFHSLVKQNSQLTLMSDDMGSFSGDRQIFIPVGVFKGCKVAVKKIEDTNINLTRSLMLELKQMKDLQHDHLVKFYGACLNPLRSFLLMEYCPKGSLQDILENEQFQLDWMFKLSLMHDIIRGMHFLHSSDIKSHGNLKSSNCVVDSRFVLKITDFGLHTLRKNMQDVESEVEKCNSHAYWSKLLWTAPELLRMENNRPPEGTQKADVYSFGIIVHEITTRQGPFYLGETEDEKSPQDIVELVKGYPILTLQPFRPYIDECDNYLDINGIMTKCWSEDPIERPDFNALKTIVRKINKDNETGNIVDNLLKRMEQYANNLEELVEERTQDYLEQKKKCEQLLYQLLPQSVAAQLISGQPVVAETFDQVTIYFSDIVGFTAISAESTPMQVVQFLNDLYTCFDSIVENFDVYKVETIGDAYMVVSGLPIRNGNQHAREIARLALALLEAVHNFKIHHRPDDRLKLRIGLHTGACVAGVVGLKMPRYCLFGDTVNTASRMESNGEALKIHISEKTKLALDEFGTFITTKRGFVPMKGKGEMLTYWLEGEMTKPDLTLSPNKMLLSRRSSLKQPPRYGLTKMHSEISTIPLIQQQQSIECKNSPNLRVKRKISSSSPKLNSNDCKTEDFYYYLDAAKQSQNERYNPLSRKRDSAGAEDIYSSRSLREPTKDSTELANFRLPLSGALKNHNNNYSTIRHENSNSNLSGILHPSSRVKLKQSPTISTLMANARAEYDNCSLSSANRITFCVREDAFEDVEDVNDEHEDESTQLHTLNDNCNTNNDNCNTNSSKAHLLEENQPYRNISPANKLCNSNNFNHIVKTNNIKNYKLLCRNASNSDNDRRDSPVLNGGSNNGTVNGVIINAVTQPLLTKINS